MTGRIQTTCCIAGGGPAGMMLGFLLARAGVPVVVLEKHADFLRDFRGDTVHPSTLELMHELGLLDAFLQRPHDKVTTLSGKIGSESVQLVDLSHVPTRCKFVAFMPQWDFLNFLAEKGKHYPAFDLRMQAQATGLIETGGRVEGVRVKTPEGEIEIRANLVIAADGRRSALREQAKLQVEDLGAPMDVLWFRISRKPDDPGDTFGHIEAGLMFIMLNRGDYWQCAFIIAKGGFDELQAKGLQAFRDTIVWLSPFLKDRVAEIASFDDVKLLTVAVDRLRQWWKPGLLCIGDAAHAMSPIGGVGINLAVQDAVASANILTEKLQSGSAQDSDLAAVQARRMFPTRATQAMQLMIQNRVIRTVLAGTKPRVPLILKLTQWFPMLQRIPAYLIGIGFRPEHIRTPEMKSR